MEITESIVALSLTSVFVFVGLPVWWETTKVYRAALPYYEISSLATRINNNLTFRLQWNVLIEETLLQSNSIPLTSFTDTFSPLAEKGLPFGNLQITYKAFEPDLSIINATRADGTTVQTLFDNIMKSIENKNKGIIEKRSGFFYHNIIILTMPFHISKMLGRDQILLVGESGVIVLTNFESCELKNCLQWIVPKLQDILLPMCGMEKNNTMEECSAEETPLQSLSGFDISFTLANSNPFEYIVDWNIEMAIGTELMPFLQRISDFGPFRISSQILNFIDVGIKPKKLANGGYFYSSKTLPLLINPFKSHLNEYTSNNPILHFIQYIPPSSYMPLMFKKKGGTFMSFTSPQWGSVVIKNLIGKSMNNSISSQELSNNSLSNQELGAPTLEIEADITQILLHFRELIGLKRKAFDEIFYAPVDKSAVAKWEIDYLFLKGTVENLRKSISNMVSLAALLEEIANIVIRNDIRSQLEHAITNIKDSESFLAEGQLRESFLASKSALSISNKAFYDHSLLSLLYFPDDQKYAIYLPLFFPIFVPLCMSFVLAVRTFLVHYKTK